MNLTIYTMQRAIYEGTTPRIILPTAVGEVTILDNHEPYITVLAPGDIKYIRPFVVGPNEEEKEETFPISGGFAEVRTGSEVRILADE